MAHYRNPAHGARPAPPAEPELEIARQIGAWNPPTPRWRDAPARARINKYVQVQQQHAGPTAVARVRHRLDLIGWILGQSGEGLLNMFEDSSDPRVITYNRISGPAYRHNGPQGVLLRLVYAGV
jgi:hypothetical protein